MGGAGGGGGRAGGMAEDWKYLIEISLSLGCRLVQVFQFTIASLHILNRDKTVEWSKLRLEGNRIP